MSDNITLYSKIVAFKKTLFKRRVMPKAVAFLMDSFFNNLHSNIMATQKDSREALETENGMGPIKKKILFYVVFPASLALNLISLVVESLSLFEFLVSEESDKEAVSNINAVVANSKNVQRKIKKIYGLDARVIHPPITTNIPDGNRNHEDYWLSVNRLTPEKRTHLQVKAFGALEDKLVVVGGYDNCHATYFNKLKRTAGSNVVFLGNVSEERLQTLYAHCKGLITSSRDEDFGMNAVEAMASGKPVIAPNEGGYKETVIDGATGTLIDDINEYELIKAVRNMGAILKADPNHYVAACRRRAGEFDVRVFMEGVQNEIIKQHAKKTQ